MDSNSLMTAIAPVPSQGASDGGSGGPEVSKTADDGDNGLFKKELGAAMGGAGDSVGGKADPSAEQRDEAAAADDSRVQEQQGEGQALAAPGNGVPPAPQQLVLSGERGMPLALASEVSAATFQSASSLPRLLEPALGLPNSRSGSPWSPQSVALGGATDDPTPSPMFDMLANRTSTSDALKSDLVNRLEQRLGVSLNSGPGRGETAGLLSGPASPTPDNPAGLLATLASSAVSGSGEPGATQAPTMPRFLATLATPFNDPRWQGDFGQRVALLAKSGLQRADIKLNPAHLGPVEVRITMNDDQQASVTFFAKHGVVRDAIEATMPRLREMLSEQGMNLADSNVSDQSLGGRHGQDFAQGDGSPARAGREERDTGEPTGLTGLAEPLAQSRLTMVIDGGDRVDYYV